jgi:glycosyltransferase involved in cell wall biosynthesis
MKFSIVVPSFNHARYLPDCLDSILAQRFSGIELEIVVMDGGSTDGSREIIEERGRHLSFFQSQRDGGQTDALIQGFAKTSGDIMGWLNSDDMLVSGALEAVWQTFVDDADADVLYGDMDIISANGRTHRVHREIDFDPDILLWVHDYIPQPSTFWRRRIWERVEGLRQEFTCAMDYDLWMQFMAAGANFRHIPVYFRDSGLIRIRRTNDFGP